MLDVDLAGREEWWHRTGGDLRVMRDITWPRLVLHYVQRDAAEAVLRQDRERVLDMNYLWRSAYVRFDSRPLPYERVMLHDWFARRFCPKSGRNRSNSDFGQCSCASERRGGVASMLLTLSASLATLRTKKFQVKA